ncbi:MAG: nuclear transport factor 2 family protein [Betaproteobacteria bacterium]|nr:nuclear transport factor 2 family protein [Betaproteobacteria bacterium]
MDIDSFMQGYKRAWETSDEHLLASLFAADGVYRNTPFAEQRGHAAIKAYWQRTKLQGDIHLDYEILCRRADGGLAHWRTTYQVMSEELFAIWAASTGTNLLARGAGDPLPRLVLDGVADVTLDAGGLAREFRIWWHSRIAGD